MVLLPTKSFSCLKLFGRLTEPDTMFSANLGITVFIFPFLALEKNTIFSVFSEVLRIAIMKYSYRIIQRSRGNHLLHLANST